jgi:hypothetical protein
VLAKSSESFGTLVEMQLYIVFDDTDIDAAVAGMMVAKL